MGGPPDRQPTLLARRGDGTTVSGDEYIGLPTAEDPLATVYRRATGRWVLENEQGVRSVSHREQVVVGGTIWRLFLPGTSLRTEEDRERQVGIGEIRIEFTVSSDEEDVDIVVEHGERRTPLKSRSHHYLLLTLARERIAAARDGVPAAEQGWVTRTISAGCSRWKPASCTCRCTARVDSSRPRESSGPSTSLSGGPGPVRFGSASPDFMSSGRHRRTEPTGSSGISPPRCG